MGSSTGFVYFYCKNFEVSRIQNYIRACMTCELVLGGNNEHRKIMS